MSEAAGLPGSLFATSVPSILPPFLVFVGWEWSALCGGRPELVCACACALVERVGSVGRGSPGCRIWTVIVSFLLINHHRRHHLEEVRGIHCGYDARRCC